MKLRILNLNGSLICLKCGFLSRPTSSTTRALCTLRGITRQAIKPRPLLTNISSKLLQSDRRATYNVVQKSRAAKGLSQIKWSDLKFMFSLANKHKGRLLAGLSLLCISSGVFLSLPKILGSLIDQASNVNRDDPWYRFSQYLKQNHVLFAAILIVGGLATAMRIYLFITAGQLIINDLRLKVFRSLMRLDIAFFDRSTNSVGELVSRLSSDVAIVGHSVSSNLMDGVRALVGTTGATAMMIYTSPDLCAVGAVAGPFIFGIGAVAGIFASRITKRMQDTIASTNQVAMERLSNIKTVRMLVSEEKEINTYKDKVNEIWLVSRMQGFLSGTTAGLMQFSVYGTLTAMFFYGGQLISTGALTYGDLSSFLLYSGICAYNINVLINSFYMELMKGLGAATRLIELSTEIPKIPLTGGIKIDDLKREISFQSVSFTYPDNQTLFNDITFRIPAGKSTAIVGASGSGKSTIANLLLRLYDPIQGRIMIDDINLKDLDPSHWRRMIGTVSQEPVLFTTSIKNNIAYAAENPELITDEQIEEAARQANCIDFIKNKPEGFETLVGEFGSTGLSGGEKQRIAIARAWLMNPRILILDEATSALDAESEYFIRIALRSLLKRHQQTVIIIAHRLSTIKHSDQIVVLDKGRIAELGSYDELLSIKDGIFKKLVEKQAIGWREDNF